MYDLIIIGAGPAGISASLYAKRANLKVLILYYGKSNVEKATNIDNYYGFPGGISGKKLFEDGIKQAKELDIEVKKIEVVGIENLGETYNVKTEDGNLKTKSIILSTGNKKITPDIKGIKEFEGRGISYCAICDAFFYKNKQVAVIGDGNFALNEANELLHVAKSVNILTNGVETTEINKEKNKFNINGKKIKCIKGDTKVKEIEFEDGSNLQIDGIFIALGEAGASDFAKTLGILQNGNDIKVNEKMETNLKGIYACGNATGGLLQICKAVYEGAVAGLSAAEYIRGKEC